MLGKRSQTVARWSEQSASNAAECQIASVSRKQRLRHSDRFDNVRRSIKIKQRVARNALS